MEYEMVLMRILHIGFGVLWAGAALSVIIILGRRLRELGPDYQRPVMRVVARVIGPMLGISGIVTILVGLAMALRIAGSNHSLFTSTGWGWAIMIGFVVSVAAFISGLMLSNTAGRAAALKGSNEEGASTSADAGQLEAMSGRTAMLGHVTAALVFIGVFSMAVARFV